MTKNVWHLYRCYTCTCIYTYVYIYVICVCVCVSYIYHKCIIYHRLISYIYILCIWYLRMYCIPTMRSDVWPQTSLAGLLNSAGLQTNFRHLGASQMAFVLLRCGRVGVGRPITYASELDYLYLHSMCNMYIIYIHICKYDFKYV